MWQDALMMSMHNELSLHMLGEQVVL